MDGDFKLFAFQEDAVDALRTAGLNWMAQAAEQGPPKYGMSPIPFLGQLRAVTGAGKTPILARVVGGLGSGLVLWTSRSSAVVEQTYNNLRGKYAPLLPIATKVLRDIPGQSEWRNLIQAADGLTIWVLTVASWNEAESAQTAGSQEARLNLHRPHPDWAGDTSPWDQLRNELRRPLWIVSDESHNQSSVQLEQLAELRPKGFFMASATPVENERFTRWKEALSGDPTWSTLAKAGIVSVRTRDVVEAELLKTTIDLIDYNSGTEESLDGTIEALRQLDEAATAEGAAVTPRAIYVVEKSNLPKGVPDDPPPVVIWRHLRARGIPTDEIAVYTDTKELPEGAERVSSLSGLHARYRHIIFNQSLQEGWDDPEAYVCYFDGVTKSFTRIRQIVRPGPATAARAAPQRRVAQYGDAHPQHADQRLRHGGGRTPGGDASLRFGGRAGYPLYQGEDEEGAVATRPHQGRVERPAHPTEPHTAGAGHGRGCADHQYGRPAVDARGPRCTRTWSAHGHLPCRRP